MKPFICKKKTAEEESSNELPDLSPTSSPAARRTSISLSIRSLSFRSNVSRSDHSETVRADSSSHSYDTDDVSHAVKVNYQNGDPSKSSGSSKREQDSKGSGTESKSSSESESESEEEDYLEEILEHVQWESLIFFITLFILAGELSDLGFMQV